MFIMMMDKFSFLQRSSLMAKKRKISEEIFLLNWIDDLILSYFTNIVVVEKLEKSKCHLDKTLN